MVVAGAETDRRVPCSNSTPTTLPATPSPRAAKSTSRGSDASFTSSPRGPLAAAVEEEEEGKEEEEEEEEPAVMVAPPDPMSTCPETTLREPSRSVTSPAATLREPLCRLKSPLPLSFSTGSDPPVPSATRKSKLLESAARKLRRRATAPLKKGPSAFISSRSSASELSAQFSPRHPRSQRHAPLRALHSPCLEQATCSTSCESSAVP
mmetsp:Transcript_9650/g.17758  ORF Transcript_9650/g.17758 Transcript_9650/m.17758 type:complete len:208 (+) Transcript_9650:147-770(+)